MLSPSNPLAVDPEAATAAVRQVVKEAGSPVGPEALLQKVFLAIGWDKTETPAPAASADGSGGDEDQGGEDDGEGDGAGDDNGEGGSDGGGKEDEEGDGDAAAAAATAPEPIVSNNALDVWKVLVGEDTEAEADVREIMARLAVRVKGYGEAQVRFAVGIMDPDGASGVDETGLWRALTATAARPLEGVKRSHLRKLWRTADTWLPQLPEDAEEAGKEAMDAAQKAIEEAKVAPRRVVVESWFEKLGEDEFAAGLLLPEIEVPKETKGTDEEGDEDDGGDA